MHTTTDLARHPTLMDQADECRRRAAEAIHADLGRDVFKPGLPYVPPGWLGPIVVRDRDGYDAA